MELPHDAPGPGGGPRPPVRDAPRTAGGRSRRPGVARQNDRSRTTDRGCVDEPLISPSDTPSRDPSRAVGRPCRYARRPCGDGIFGSEPEGFRLPAIPQNSHEQPQTCILRPGRSRRRFIEKPSSSPKSGRRGQTPKHLVDRSEPTHNPKVVGSNPTPATKHFGFSRSSAYARRPDRQVRVGLSGLLGLFLGTTQRLHMQPNAGWQNASLPYAALSRLNPEGSENSDARSAPGESTGMRGQGRCPGRRS